MKLKIYGIINNTTGGKYMPDGITYVREPQKMISTANIINSETQKIRNYYDNIATQCQRLRNHWEGENADLFLSKIMDLTKQTPELLDILTKYFSELNTIANQFIQNEKSNVGIAQELRIDVFNV